MVLCRYNYCCRSFLSHPVSSTYPWAFFLHITIHNQTQVIQGPFTTYQGKVATEETFFEKVFKKLDDPFVPTLPQALSKGLASNPMPYHLSKLIFPKFYFTILLKIESVSSKATGEEGAGSVYEGGAVLDHNLSLMATAAPVEEGKRALMTYATDAEGRPIGLPLDLFLFSSTIKAADPDKVNSINDFSMKNKFPEMKQFPTYETGKMVGRTPLSNDFHLRSNRERRGPDDDGLEDEDLTHADGITRKRKLLVEKRKSIIYDNIWVYKGEFLFPYRTYRPKVQVAYKGEADQVPQAVVVERLHRLYKRTDINLVLQTLGIEASDLIPPPNYSENNARFNQEMMFRNRVRVNGVFKRDFILHGGVVTENINEEHLHTHLHAPKDEGSSLSYVSSCLTPSSQELSNESPTNTLEAGESKMKMGHHDHLKHEDVHPFIKQKPPFGHMFPLNCFDNFEFDIRHPNDWIGLGWDGKERIFYPLPGKAFLPLPGGVVKRNTQALSEMVVDHLLTSTPRLRKLYQWLLRERFERTVRMCGIAPDQVKNAPTEEEMNLLTRLDSTVNPLFPGSTPSIIEKMTREIKPTKDGDAEEATYNSTLSGGEVLGEHTTSSSGPRTELVDAEAQDILLKNIVYKPWEPRLHDSDLSIFGEDGSQNQNPKNSLIDDTQALDTPMQTEEENFDAGDETDAEDIDADPESNEVSVSQKPYYHHNTHTDSGPRPPSPDTDSLIEGHGKYVMEFDKMKKVHVHEWKWVDVAIFYYNEETERFYVRTIYPPVVHAWVDKIYLCFDGEDPNQHGKRIRDAVVRRIEFENVMRFNLYVDCLPVEDFPGIDTKTMGAITSKSLSTAGLKYNDQSLSKVIKEIDLEYKRTAAQGRFIQLVEKHHHLYKPWVVIPDSAKAMFNLTVPDSTAERKRLQFIVSEIPKQSFAYKKKRLRRLSVQFCEKEPSDALSRIREICLDARRKSLILIDLEPLALADWQEKQLDNIAEVRNYLQFGWYKLIVGTLNEHLGKIPRSWYNLKEKNVDVFAMSKLRNYLFLINMIMEDTLKAIVVESLQNLVSHVKEITKEIDYKRRFLWRDGDLINSLYPTPTGISPIWALEILMEPDAIKYSELLSNFSVSVQKVFSAAVAAVRKLPNLLPQVMPQMKIVVHARHYLHTPMDNEPELESLNFELLQYLKRSLLPVDTYVQLYNRYLDTWNCDAVLNQWESKRHTKDEVAEQVSRHMKQEKELEKDIPLEINITGCKISVEGVREQLLIKKRYIYSTMLDNYAERLKQIVIRIHEDYAEMEPKCVEIETYCAEIEKKLNEEGPKDLPLEELVEQKTRLWQVRCHAGRLEEMIRQVVKNYDIFNPFLYEIPDEDVTTKWQAAVHTAKTMKRINILVQKFDGLETQLANAVAEAAKAEVEVVNAEAEVVSTDVEVANTLGEVASNLAEVVNAENVPIPEAGNAQPANTDASALSAAVPALSDAVPAPSADVPAPSADAAVAVANTDVAAKNVDAPVANSEAQVTNTDASPVANNDKNDAQVLNTDAAVASTAGVEATDTDSQVANFDTE